MGILCFGSNKVATGNNLYYAGSSIVRGEKRKQKTNRPLKRIEDYPEMFGIDVCSELIGQSKHTIYKLTSHKEIPCYRAESGRILRFKRDEIITWMMAKRQETKQEFIESMELGFVARLRK